MRGPYNKIQQKSEVANWWLLSHSGLKLCFIWLNITSNKVNFKMRRFYVKVHC